MRTIAPALALLVGALSVVLADPALALERLSDEVRIAGRPLALSGRGNEAVVALLAEAESDLAAGRPEQAVVTLERALRIEPRNPTVWHYLGLARLDTGDFAQAETMASRSHSLAPGDRALRSRNSRLVATARQASGQPADPLPEGLDMLAEETERQSVWSLLPSRGETQRSRTVQPQAWRARETTNDDRARREYSALRQECRIWYPDRPPSRQPPPIACDEAPRQLPRGAVLLVSI
jgi:tetratricopeptide (TPR) repeat protein